VKRCFKSRHFRGFATN